MVFEQFFTDPPPEGESAKVPPAGSHFGRYFGTLLFGGSPRSGRQCSIDFRSFPCKKHKKWQWDKRFSNRRYSKDHPNVEGFILGFLVIWTTFALCNIFYLKSVWPHPQKASSIWNNSWISSIITVCTIYVYIYIYACVFLFSWALNLSDSKTNLGRLFLWDFTDELPQNAQADRECLKATTELIHLLEVFDVD